MRRRLAIALATGGAALICTAAAGAAPVSSVLGGQTVGGGAIPCTVQGDGVRVCHGSDGGGGSADLRLRSFDGAPLELYVMLPPAGSTDGPYPLVVQNHGWGGSAGGPGDTQYSSPDADTLAGDGYAVLQLTARGFGDSCGKATPPAAAAVCGEGYIHLDDARYEARDVQYAIGLLVDAGLVDPAAIGVTGESYGGGVSLELATLRDRVMNPNGSLSPWTSPAGTPLGIAAAAPVIPWSDLVYSLVPDGRTRDDAVVAPSDDLTPDGVAKQSLLAGLFAGGTTTGTFNPRDPQADIPGWFGAIEAGEPYEKNALIPYIVGQLARYRSPYYLLDGAYGAVREQPAPLLIASGFTDDLFPVDEALRYLALERALFPSAPAGLIAGDFGHPRAQNKNAEKALLAQRILGFFDHYLRGSGPVAALGATAFTETCPAAAPSGGPFSATTWSALHPGQVSLSSPTTQTIASAAGDAAIAAAVDPVTGHGACATVSARDQGTGVATYRLPAAGAAGYTLLGAPTVTAALTVNGIYPYIAARLWDVDPGTNSETLVSRGVYRVNAAQAQGVQSFQLHPGAWYFAPGHVVKLELLGQDPGYLRPSNGSFAITVNQLRLVLPVHEVPGIPGVARFGTPVPAACVATPGSRITFARALRRGVQIVGSATETSCPGDSPSARRAERLSAVFVTVGRYSGHGNCRFTGADGRLGPARSCLRAPRLRARGTTRWQLSLRGRPPAGAYFIDVDAVDGRHRHQLALSSGRLSVS